MNLRSSRYYGPRTPKMPVGLVELMEELSRDVLKNNPTDIYSFCANHMKKLLVIRDGSKSKKAKNIDERIAIAQRKVNERAALRRKNYDKKIEEMTNSTKCLKEYSCGPDMNAEQYVQERVIKILENDLKDNKEHEIITTVDKDNQKSETVNVNTTTAVKMNEIVDNNESVLSTPVQFIDQFSQKSISQTDTYKDDNNITNDPEDNVMNEVLNESAKTDKEENEAVEASKPLTNVEENNKNDNNNELLKLESNIDKNQCHSENEYVNEHEDKNTKSDNDLKEQDNSEIEINEVEKVKSLSDNTDDLKINSSSTPTVIDNDNKETQSTEEQNSVDVNNTQKCNDDSSKIAYSESRNHINNHSMDLETAAITIQKVFRSFLFRNKTQSIDDVTNIDVNLLVEDKEHKDAKEDPNINKVKDRRTLGINRMDTVLQTVNEEKSLSLSTDDSSTLSSAATIIQAHVRGFLVRNKFNNNKTTSSTSGIDSDAQSFTSLEGDNDYRKNKTILNIHIVPESGHFMSRDESMLTSIDLSLDGSPPSSTNLHPLGYDKSERRKLKREDAIQSISPPSNNSGKLSEDIDSVKEILINNDNNDQQGVKTEMNQDITDKSIFSTNVMNDENISTMIDHVKTDDEQHVKSDDSVNIKRLSTLVEMASDEMDVVTPSTSIDGNTTVSVSDTKLLHSGECHDIVLPTKVSRNDASIVREFQNVVVYFLLWNNS